MRELLITGAVLLAISAPPLVQMRRETVIAAAVNERYTVERILSSERGMEGGALQAEIGGHRLELLDDQPFTGADPFTAHDVRVPGPVRIAVDGRVHSSPVQATIRLNRRDANRYWGFVYLTRLVDREGPERLVVAQNLSNGRFRTTSLFPDGRILDDEFDYPGRCSPPVRALLIRHVVPHPSGYCSDVMQQWPSLFYPVLYPWLSGALGGVLTFVGGVVWLLRRRGEA